MKLLVLFMCIAVVAALRTHHKNPFHKDGPCGHCYRKALRDAKELKGHHKHTFVGHACRGGRGLVGYCKWGKPSKTGGLHANHWFFVHCSPDGPWCKPCATRTLFYTKKCDACEKTRFPKKCSK